MTRIVGLIPALALLVLIAAPGLQAQTQDAETWVAEINQKVREGQVYQAADHLDKAVSEHPESNELHELRIQISNALRAQGELEASVGQIAKLVDWRIKQLTEQGKVDRALAQHLTLVVSMYRRQKGNEEAMSWLEEQVEAIRGVEQAEEPETLMALQLEVVAAYATQLATSGRQDEGVELLRNEFERLEGRIEERGADEHLIGAKIRVLETLARVDRDRETWQAKIRETVERYASEFPHSPALISGYINQQMMAAGLAARNDPDQAEKHIEELEQFLSEVESDEPEIRQLIQMTLARLAATRRTIESTRRMAELIDSEMTPVEAIAWANGEELTMEDLKGKVVLLDFWAVWCGPCIATFPHLRKWHEEYSDRGFVLIGVTQYYNYHWDEEADRAVRADGEVSHEDELKMLEKFAEQHDLPYTFAVTERDFFSEYAVTGIPQAVVIDREGKIRLIKVGSGDQNARELEAKIEELLGAQVETASQIDN